MAVGTRDREGNGTTGGPSVRRHRVDGHRAEVQEEDRCRYPRLQARETARTPAASRGRGYPARTRSIRGHEHEDRRTAPNESSNPGSRRLNGFQASKTWPRLSRSTALTGAESQLREARRQSTRRARPRAAARPQGHTPQMAPSATTFPPTEDGQEPGEDEHTDRDEDDVLARHCKQVVEARGAEAVTEGRRRPSSGPRSTRRETACPRRAAPGASERARPKPVGDPQKPPRCHGQPPKKTCTPWCAAGARSSSRRPQPVDGAANLDDRPHDRPAGEHVRGKLQEDGLGDLGRRIAKPRQDPGETRREADQ